MKLHTANPSREQLDTVSPRQLALLRNASLRLFERLGYPQSLELQHPQETPEATAEDRRFWAAELLPGAYSVRARLKELPVGKIHAVVSAEYVVSTGAPMEAEDVTQASRDFYYDTPRLRVDAGQFAALNILKGVTRSVQLLAQGKVLAGEYWSIAVRPEA